MWIARKNMTLNFSPSFLPRLSYHIARLRYATFSVDQLAVLRQTASDSKSPSLIVSYDDCKSEANPCCNKRCACFLSSQRSLPRSVKCQQWLRQGFFNLFFHLGGHYAGRGGHVCYFLPAFRSTCSKGRRGCMGR